MELTDKLREIHHIGDAEPVYVIHTTMNEAELRDAICNARQRERCFMCIALAVVAVLAVIYGLYSEYGANFWGVAFCVFLIVERIAGARRHTNKVITQLQEKYGFAGAEETIWFFDEHVVAYDHIRDSSRGYVYAHFQKLYCKRTFLFLCWAERQGHFIRNADIADKDALIRFLKQKNPSMELKK